MKVSVTNDIGTGNMHLTFYSSGTGTEDFECGEILQDDISYKLELFIVLGSLVFVGFGCEYFLYVRYFNFIDELREELVLSLVRAELILVDDLRLSYVEYTDGIFLS